MSTGAELIATERQRQIDVEGWTPEHDDNYEPGELRAAAVCYAQRYMKGPHPFANPTPELWPWEDSWWKPVKDPVRNLVKAGALIAAEIDRLQRQAQTTAE